MGAKRSTERMERLRGRFYDGMAANGIERRAGRQDLRPSCWRSPTSASRRATRSASRRWSTTAPGSSSTTRRRSARRCSTPSRWASTRRSRWWPTPAGTGCGCAARTSTSAGPEAVLQPDAHSAGGQAVRLGLAEIRTIGDEARPSRSRPSATARRPYRDLADLARRVRLTVPQAEALATAGALGCFGVDRRAALWAAGVVAAVRPDQLPGTAVGLDAPALPGMTAAELTVADVWATGVSPDSHPIEHLRERLDRFGALRDRPTGRRGSRGRTGRAAPGAGRRPGHAPAAAGHRGRGHVPQPGGRDRHAQRHLLGGAVARATGRWRSAAPRCWCGDGWNAARRGC